MTISDQSASSPRSETRQVRSSEPTARDLLNLLHEIEMGNPSVLDMPLCWPDEDGMTSWMGVLEVDYEEKEIRLCWDLNDVIRHEMRVRQEAQLEARRNTPVALAHSKVVDDARCQGLLPPGA